MANSLANQRLPSRAKFTLSSSSSSSPSDDEDDNIPLPFPAALPRSDFLAADFQPAEYLSALPNRHQTLEDLRSDLRDRSDTISAELLELVNSNYTAFLSLGDELRGGDEKTETVKVALLGFQRAIDEVKGKVTGRKEEMVKLGGELREVREEVEKGRSMLEVSQRLTALEERLAVDSLQNQADDKNDWSLSDEDEDGEEEEQDGDEKTSASHTAWIGSSPAKLIMSAKQCKQIELLKERLDEGHPFVIKLSERLARCRHTLLLDLGTALREAKLAGPNGKDRVWRYLKIYRLLDAQDEAVKALRGG